MPMNTLSPNNNSRVFSSKPKVAAIHCPEYDPDLVEAGVREAVALLGGIEEFVRPGERVLIKPNLLIPKQVDDAVTTHPAVVRAVAILVREAGGSALIGDSPGGPFTVGMLRRVYRASHLEEVARETGAQLNYDTGTVDLPNPDGRLVKRFRVMKALAEADCVISVPKLKTHALVGFTGAVKVLFGVIPGLDKAEFHLRMPRVEDFAEMLVDVDRLVKPRLTVMDAVIGMEGNGPSAGRPRRLGALLASPDSTACDTVACAVAGIPAETVATLVAARRRNWPGSHLSQVEVVGSSILSLKPAQGFVLPGTRSIFRRIPVPVYNVIERFLRPKPVTTAALCSGCADCARICPAEAIVMEGLLPRTDYDACIRCFCCHEVCPDTAIDIWRPRLARLLGGRF